MIIVVDANIICTNFKLDGTVWKVLLDGLPQANHTLIVPQVALDEAVNKQREVLEDEVKKIRASERILGRAVVDPERFSYPEVNIAEEARRYRELLDARLEEAGANISPYPKASHEQMVERALARQKPFRDGDKGYRDALIWETVIEVLQNTSEELMFITTNSRDFKAQDDNGHQLHLDLRADLDSRGIDPSRLRVAWKLREFVDEFRVEFEEAATEARLHCLLEQLQDGVYDELDISEELRDKLPRLLEGWDLERVDLGLRYDYQSPELTVLEDINGFHISNVAILHNGELLVIGSATITATVTIWSYAYEWNTLSPDEEAEIIGGDVGYEDVYSDGQIIRTFKVGFQLTYDEKTKEVTSWGVDPVRANRNGSEISA